MIVEYMPKLASDVLDYVVDLRRWLGRGEWIISAQATSSPSTLAILDCQFTRTAVTVRVGAGAGQHIVAVTMTTNIGQTKTVQFGIAVKADSGRGLPVISVVGGLVVGGSAGGGENGGGGGGGGGTTPTPGRPAISVPDTAVSPLLTTNGPAPDPVGGGTPDPGEQTDVVLGPLVAQGSRLVMADDIGGPTVVLRAVNWFGAESENNLPHGIWQVSYKQILDQIKAMGFNTIRMPFSGDTFRPASVVPVGAVNLTIADNLEFVVSGDPAVPSSVVMKSPMDCMRVILDYCQEIKLRVVLDHHRRKAGAGADGWPLESSYNNFDWEATWVQVAEALGGYSCVIGADMHNEPHAFGWDDWAYLVEMVAPTLLDRAPHWLIIVEGVATEGGFSYWWGGNLSGVLRRPIDLGSYQAKLVYSPHEYGQSVGHQEWLSTDNRTAAGYPANLPDIWDNAWGFIAKRGIAPVWIGEYGGKLGYNGSGQVDPGYAPHSTFERQWLATLATYVKSAGISHAYWSMNPNSVDTGGLLQDDWATPQAGKLALLQGLLTP